MHPRRVLAAAVVVMGWGAVALLPAPSQAAVVTSGPVPPHVIPPLTDTDLPPGTLVVNREGVAVLADTATGCGSPAASPVPDGKPIVVSIVPGPAFTVGKIPSTWWRRPPYGDSGWQLQLRGMMWVQPLAERAYRDGQKQSLRALVDQVLAFHRQNPDPGTRTAAATNNANAWGWDEGTSLRRLSAENCLYAVTKDARLPAVMAADVAVQFGPRYYGPPGHQVHNHGVMADLDVVRAADLLGQPTWRSRSINRLVTNAPGAWSRAGVTNEQSSSYHVFNTALWGRVVTMLRQHGVASASVTKVQTLVDRAGQVSAWLTEPDGRLVVLGDSSADPGFTRSRWTARTFRDDQSGFAIGKWSWTDATTTYYSIRYGPRRAAHGQQERAGITWSTRGRRVLVGPGKGVYDPAGNYRAWALGPASHNVATVDGRALDTGASVAMLSANLTHAAWHTWNTVDALFGVRHVRQYVVLRDSHTLRVTDTYGGRARFHQFWHLDPAWTYVSSGLHGTRLTFRWGVRVLTVTTTGSTSLVRGVTRPVAGWNFPDGTRRIPAYELRIAAAGSATTTFVVS